MSTIYVVGGVGSGSTEMASYDAALAAANLHNYNLVTVSSVVPEGAAVEAVDVAPDLGPAGNRLTVVQARATTEAGGRVAAGLGWATGPGPGLFYEAAGGDPVDVHRRVEDGLAAGRDLRDWTFDDQRVVVTDADAADEGYTTAVTLAAYGRSEPIL
jgi:arginine decarboxylase